MPAQWLKPDKPSHHRREKAVENPQVAIGVGLKHLGTMTTQLIIYREDQEAYSANSVVISALFASIGTIKSTSASLGQCIPFFLC